MEISVRALLITAYFIVMLPISYFSRKWLWKMICNEGGTTPKEVRKKSAELVNESIGGRNLQNVFESWLRQNASNPDRVSNLLKIYRICLAPNIIFLAISFYNLVNPRLTQICLIGMVLVAIISIALFIFGFFAKKKNERK